MRNLSSTMNTSTLLGARVWHACSEYVVMQNGERQDTVDIAPPGVHDATLWMRDVPVRDICQLGVLDVRQEQNRFETTFTRFALLKNGRGEYWTRETREAFDVWIRSACVRTQKVQEYPLADGAHVAEFVCHPMRPVVTVSQEGLQVDWTENGRRQSFRAPVPEERKRSPDGVLEDVQGLMRTDFSVDSRRREPHLPLDWNQELGYENPDVAARWEGFVAGWQAHDRRVAQVYVKPVWDGKGLPPVGADILFNTSSTVDEVGTVVGYRTQGDLGGATRLHRVYVSLLYKGTLTPNERMLSDVRPLHSTTQPAA